MRNFPALLTQAISAVSKDGPTVGGKWLDILRNEITRTDPKIDPKKVHRFLTAVYKRRVKRAQVVNVFSPADLDAQAFPLLSQRIAINADLIKLDRDNAIETTLRRFAGWASSVPEQGSRAIDRREVKAHIAKPLRQLPFTERRMMIDQGFKLAAAIDHVEAELGGAIAMRWRHVHQAGYDARPEHVARDGKVFALRGNWAMEKGLMKRGPHPYYDEIDAVAEKPYCQCWAEPIYSVAKLPDDMKR